MYIVDKLGDVYYIFILLIRLAVPAVIVGSTAVSENKIIKMKQ